MATISKIKSSKGIISYSVQVRLKGHKPVNATFKRLTDARKFVQDTESAIRNDRYFPPKAAQHTFGEMVTRYTKELPQGLKSTKQRTYQLNWWQSRLKGSTPLKGITFDDIEAAKVDLEGLSDNTKLSYLGALTTCFNTAVNRYEWLDVSPMHKVRKPKEPQGRLRFLSDEERQALLSACQESSNPWLYMAVVIALSTGMRRAELFNLTWKDVDLKRGEVLLTETKNGESRRIAVTGLALELLKAHNKVRRLDTNMLFPGTVHKTQAVNLRAPFEKALLKAGITEFTWHDLRHSCASYLAMNGCSVLEISRVLGHKSAKMSERYSHLSDKHTRTLLNDLTQKMF